MQDWVKKHPKLELDPPADAVVRRTFDIALQGKSILDVTKTLNAEGVASPRRKKWLKATIHTMLDNEVYTGALVWGTNAKDKAEPVRIEKAFPAIVSKREFRRAKKLLGSRAPKKSVHPRHAVLQPLPTAATRRVERGSDSYTANLNLNTKVLDFVQFGGPSVDFYRNRFSSSGSKCLLQI